MLTFAGRLYSLNFFFQTLAKVILLTLASHCLGLLTEDKLIVHYSQGLWLTHRLTLYKVRININKS